MAWIIDQIATRTRRGQVLIVLMDGQKSLWDTIKLHLSFAPRTVPILDMLHVLTSGKLLPFLKRTKFAGRNSRVNGAYAANVLV
jgi:hypothetical protein